MNIPDRYLEDIKQTLEKISSEAIDQVIAILQAARMHGRQVFIMGNGGSASTASHFTCDLAKNTRQPSMPAFRVMGLTDNIALFSAYANDEGYENVFLKQLEALLQPGDVVLAISGSGNSQNVVRAIQYANARGALTIALTGMTGGLLKKIAQFVIHVPNPNIDQVEDIHLMLEHIICRGLRAIEDTVLLNPQPSTAETISEAGELVKELFGRALPYVQKNAADPALTKNDGLVKISQQLANKLDLHDLLGQILQVTVESVGAVGGSIVVLNEAGGVIDGALVYSGHLQNSDTNNFDQTIHHGLAGWVIENRRPALIKNTREDPRWLPRNWETDLDFSRSAICVPLLTSERVVGVLTLTRMESNHFTMEDLSLLTSITLALSYSFSENTPNRR